MSPSLTANKPTLLDLMTEEIRSEGPMSLARYMSLALSHPIHGYYMSGDPFGSEGDFTTAPEISQMFGELLGLWAADYWLKLQNQSPSNDPIILAEIGPGRGTLMADALRAAHAVPDFFDRLQVHLIETSPGLRASQKQTLKDCGKELTWHDTFQQLPQSPTILFANELFDALPTHQFERRNDIWHERCVGLLDGPNDTPALSVVLASDPAPLGIIPDELMQSANGAICEVSPAREQLARDIATHLSQQGGAALFIDYGYASPATGDTFQALKGHKFVDLFETPGKSDLTTHVDFASLAKAAETAGANVYGPAEMGPFLLGLGLEARAQALAKNAAENARNDITSAAQRLTSADQMGSLFKVLALTQANGPVPAPFVEA